MESKPAWSAVRATLPSVLPSSVGPPGQVKSPIESPIFIVAPQSMRKFSPMMHGADSRLHRPNRQVSSIESMKPVLCVRNDRDDTLGITVAALAEHGVPAIRVDAFDAEPRWPGLDEIGGLLVVGGVLYADEIGRYPYVLSSRGLWRHADASG